MKHKIKKVELMLVEGPAECCGEWQEAGDLNAAQSLVRGFRACIRNGLGHYKVDFKPHYENGDTFKGTMLISPNGRETLCEHLELYFDKATHTFAKVTATERRVQELYGKPEKTEYWKKFLNTHEIA